jgi:hypothetical protein
MYIYMLKFIILTVVIIFLVIWVLPPYFRCPEKVTLKGTLNTYTVTSGNGGIFGHTHTLSVYNSDLLSQYKNVYDVLFTCNTHIYHSHPDTNTIYGIKDNKIFNIGKFDANKSFKENKNNKNILNLEITAFHDHSLKIIKVTQNS